MAKEKKEKKHKKDKEKDKEKKGGKDGKKEKPPGIDGALSAIFALSGLLLLCSLVPGMGWRRNYYDDVFANRFPVLRNYSPITMGDKFGVDTPWMTWYQKVCEVDRQYTAPSAGSMVMEFVATGLKKKTGLAVGGALVGCASWTECRAHVAKRCVFYSRMLGAGFTCALFVIISAVLGFVCIGMMKSDFKMKSKTTKQKEKKEAALGSVVTFAGAAWALAFVGIVLFQGTLDSGLKEMKASTYWPWPDVFAGAIAVYGGNFLQLLGVLMAVTRKKTHLALMNPEEEGEEGEDEGGDAPAEPPGGPQGPPMAPGGPPMMPGQPMMPGGPPMPPGGGPPMMAGPPMPGGPPMMGGPPMAGGMAMPPPPP